TKTFWEFRHLPNLLFLHYADLSDDLDGELRRLARFLGAPIDERLWPELLAAASFESMRGRADELAPGAHFKEWRSNADSFRGARRGQGGGGVSAETPPLYDRPARQPRGRELKSGLERGRRGRAPRAL